MAAYIKDGQWLGPYDHMTLIKLPLYPIFLAGVSLLRIPAGLAQVWLYWLAASSFYILIFYPYARKIRNFLYTFLLFNPFYLQSISFLRVSRSEINTDIVVLLFASASALLLLREKEWFGKKWTVLYYATAICFSLFYINREENISLAVLQMILLLQLFVISPIKTVFIRHAAAHVLIGVSGLLVISSLNFIHYGIFAPTEFHTRWFWSAYTQINRVISSEKIEQVPVTRDMRQHLYNESPAFRELEPVLDGSLGQDWATVTEDFVFLPSEKIEIGGDYFRWVLRDAVFLTGHYKTPQAAKEYYGMLGREIQTACRNQRLSCYPAGRIIPLDISVKDIVSFVQTAMTSFWQIITFRGYEIFLGENTADEELTNVYSSITNMRTEGSSGQPNQYLISGIITVYSQIGLIVYIVLILSLLYAVARLSFVAITSSPLFRIMMMISLGFTSLLCAFTSFSFFNNYSFATNMSYLSAISVLYIIFVCMGAAWNIDLIKRNEGAISKSPGALKDIP